MAWAPLNIHERFACSKQASATEGGGQCGSGAAYDATELAALDDDPLRLPDDQQDAGRGEDGVNLG
jgi:hypothetical protein